MLTPLEVEKAFRATGVDMEGWDRKTWWATIKLGSAVVKESTHGRGVVVDIKGVEGRLSRRSLMHAKRIAKLEIEIEDMRMVSGRLANEIEQSLEYDFKPTEEFWSGVRDKAEQAESQVQQATVFEGILAKDLAEWKALYGFDQPKKVHVSPKLVTDVPQEAVMLTTKVF